MKSPFLLSLVLAAIANAFARQAPFDSPSSLEKLGRQTQVASIRAAAASSDARSAANEMDARLDTQASAHSKNAAKVVASEIAVRSLSIKGAAIQAQKEEAGTVAATQQTFNALDAAKAGIEAAEASAAAHVTKEVDKDLASTYMGLQDWKMKLLHDPVKEASKAGMKAALPYEKALQTIEKRVSDYETRAIALSNQARTLRTAATGMAGASVKLQAGGALKAAEDNMMNAHIMMNQATQFEAQGLRLLKDAHIWNVQIPTYAGAATDAAHQKTRQYVKRFYAPTPFSPGPPPPTNVFLQKRASLRGE
jgi:hypothetical protein